MKKYRIVEKNGKFYPQFRRGGWLSNFWWPIMGRVKLSDPNKPKTIRPTTIGIKDYTRYIEHAQERIDEHHARSSKKPSTVIIHEYTPKNR